MGAEYVYRTQQVAWVLLAGLLGTAAAVLAAVFQGEPAPPPWLPWLLAAPAVLASLSLCRLVVEVGGGELRWRFGWLGWPRGRVALADIERIEPCRINAWEAGLQFTGEGWLYAMGGRDALRVTRRGGRRFRLGSPDIAGLVRALEPRLTR